MLYLALSAILCVIIAVATFTATGYNTTVTTLGTTIATLEFDLLVGHHHLGEASYNTTYTKRAQPNMSHQPA